MFITHLKPLQPKTAILIMKLRGVIRVTMAALSSRSEREEREREVRER
jgi:hypothetical protein